MINTDDFIKRLEIILDYKGLNAASFADKIGVQRSSLSHLLSGRNKPSLDFILKIVEFFPDVDLYWILNGKGTFPKSEYKMDPIISTPTPTTHTTIPETKIEIQTDLFSDKMTEPKNRVDDKKINIISNTKNSAFSINEAEIDRIVIFYANGTFKTYSSK